MRRLEFRRGRRDYGILNLKANPFPSIAVPESKPKMYVGQEEVMKKLVGMVSEVAITGDSHHGVLIGAYGNGKATPLSF